MKEGGPLALLFLVADLQLPSRVVCFQTQAPTPETSTTPAWQAPQPRGPEWYQHLVWGLQALVWLLAPLPPSALPQAAA